MVLRRSPIFRILRWLGFFVYGILSFEILCRVAEFLPSLAPTDSHKVGVDSFAYTTPDHTLLFQANQIAIVPGCASRKFVETHSVILGDLGIRDFVQSTYRTGGTIFLGDSIVMSSTLPTSATFVDLVNKSCEKRDPTFQALNLGITDSGIEDHLQRLKYYLPLLKPARVVLGLYLNDSQASQREISVNKIPLRWLEHLMMYSASARLLQSAKLGFYYLSSTKFRRRFRWTGFL